MASIGKDARWDGEFESCHRPRAAGLLAIIAVVFAAGPAHAGAWLQRKGEGLAIVTTLADRADQRFDAGGDRIDDGYFYKDEMAVYAEYGITARLTAVARLAWQSVERRQGAIHDAARGLSASEVGLRAGVWQDAGRIATVQVTALLPGAGENVSNQPLGAGGEAWDVRVLWGQSFGNDRFADIQLAHRWRAEPDLDEVRLDISAGWRPAPRWHVIVQSLSVWNAEPASPVRRPSANTNCSSRSVGKSPAWNTMPASTSRPPAGICWMNGPSSCLSGDVSEALAVAFPGRKTGLHFR